MKYKFKKLIASVLGAAAIISMCSCSNSANSNTSIGTDGSIEGESEVEEVKSQSVSRSNLGITLELTGDYSDCVVNDISTQGLNSLSSNAIGGFAISKEMSGSSYVLCNIAVVPNSDIDTPEKRGAFPYIFSGNTYSIVANLPQLSAEGEDYEILSNLQAGMFDQLFTIFFDEQVLLDDISNNNTDTDNVEEGIVE